MERSTASPPSAPDPSRADATEVGVTKKVKAHGDRNFEQTILPSLGSGPVLPLWLSSRLSKLFKRVTASH